MRIVREPAAMQREAEDARKEGRTVGVVPTMGYFHEGHLSLVRRARAECDSVIVTLFVNPIQFGPSEDLAKYPRDFERDCQLVRAQNVDLMFAPDAGVMY